VAVVTLLRAGAVRRLRSGRDGDPNRSTGALLAKRCDAILAGMTDTAQRRKQVDFHHYLIVGMSLMVKKGNPHHVTGLASLSGWGSRLSWGRRRRIRSRPTTSCSPSDSPVVGHGGQGSFALLGRRVTSLSATLERTKLLARGAPSLT
jgi:hypothetical protein